jgi:hypothetical protein
VSSKGTFGAVISAQKAHPNFGKLVDGIYQLLGAEVGPAYHRVLIRKRVHEYILKMD